MKTSGNFPFSQEREVKFPSLQIKGMQVFQIRSIFPEPCLALSLGTLAYQIHEMF